MSPTPRRRTDSGNAAPRRSSRKTVPRKAAGPVRRTTGADARLRAKDLMERGIATVRADVSTAELARTFDDAGVSGLPVVDENGRLLGVVSRTDLTRALADESEEAVLRDPSTELEAGFGAEERSSEDELPSPDLRESGPSPLRARDLMSDSVITASEDETAGELAARMLEHRIHRLVVLRGRQVVGIVSATDLLVAVTDYEALLAPT